MPYDSSLDESIFTKVFETDVGQLTVSVYSYNKGVKKLQITRENKDTHGDLRFTRLGRMTKEEITSILPLIQEAIKSMD